MHLFIRLIFILLAIGHGFTALKAGDLGDSLEARIISAGHEGRVVDDLSAAFHARPSGEFLLAPANGNLRFAILIYNIDILPDRAVFSAGLAFRDPRSNQLVAFNSHQISFYYKQGMSGPVSLYLLKSVSIHLGRSVNIEFIPGPGKTRAVFDCSGLKEFEVTGVCHFNSDFIYPVGPDLKPKPDSSLSTSFHIISSGWEDMVASVSIPRFGLQGLDHFVFEISGAVLDLSDRRNETGMQFHPARLSDIRQYGADEMWEGFYLSQGVVYFPPHFTAPGQPPVSAGVNHLMIDETGFTGGIFATGLLDLQKGNLGGWNFSLDKVEIGLLRNGLEKAELYGRVGLPVLPDTQYLRYAALVSLHDQYQFSVSAGNGLTIPAFRVGQLRLDPASNVMLAIRNGVVDVAADLTGQFSVFQAAQDQTADSRSSFPDIYFQHLRISNRQPKLSLQYLGAGNTGQSYVNGFPVSISKLALTAEEGICRLDFDLSLNFKDRISARGGLRINAELKTMNNKDRWVFSRLQLQQAELHVDVARFRLDGFLGFIRRDPHFGEGFNGNISFRINLEPAAVSGSCMALFGNVAAHRYWYFDADIQLGTGIPVFAGVSINGLLGGAWQGMRVAKTGELPSSNAYGKSATGRTYMPDAAAGMGFRAGTYLQVAGKGTLQANAVLEMQFQKTGSLSRVLFYGYADALNTGAVQNMLSFRSAVHQMAAVQTPEDYIASFKPGGRMSAALIADYDVNNKICYGQLGFFVNSTAGGVGLRGSGMNGFAGRISLYFGATDWYVYAGQPLSPLSLKATIGNLASAGVGAYFLTGSKLLPPPPMPPKIAYWTGQQQWGGGRNEQQLASGNAFAFGGLMNVNAGAEHKSGSLKLYALATCEAGFDVELNRLGLNYSCKSTGQPPGINGWYSQGNYYGALDIKVGGSYRNFRIDVAQIGAGAVFSAQGPDPFYGKGNVHVSLKLIFSTVNADFGMEFGTACQPVQTSLAEEDFIQLKSPAAGAAGVSTLIQPELTFALPVNTSFTDAGGKTLRFFVEVLELKSSKPIRGAWQYDQRKTGTSFTPENALPTNQRMEINATVVLQEWKAGVNRWELVKNGTNPVKESKTFVFTTGAGESRIPITNISAAWPLPGQVNFYRRFSTKGMIRLKTGQQELFNVPGMRVIARFTSYPANDIRESEVTYNQGEISFSLPSGLYPAAMYKCRLIRQHKSIALVNSNGVLLTGSAAAGALPPAPTAPAAGAPAAGGLPAPQLLLEYNFRTSAYAIPSDKWTDTRQLKTSGNQPLAVTVSQTSGEYLERSEWPGHNSPALMQPFINLAGSRWFMDKVNPVLYQLYQKLTTAQRQAVTISRDTTSTGWIPVRKVDLTQANIADVRIAAAGSVPLKYVFADRECTLSWDGLSPMKQDLSDLKAGLLTWVQQNPAADYTTLLRLIPAASGSAIPAGTVPPATPSFTSPAGMALPAGLPVARPVSLPAAFRLAAVQAALRNDLIVRIGQLTLPAPPPGEKLTFSARASAAGTVTTPFVIQEVKWP